MCSDQSHEPPWKTVSDTTAHVSFDILPPIDMSRADDSNGFAACSLPQWMCECLKDENRGLVACTRSIIWQGLILFIYGEKLLTADSPMPEKERLRD